jgi:hypothetical protein
MEIIGLVSFALLVVAWVVLPIKSPVVSEVKLEKAA